MAEIDSMTAEIQALQDKKRNASKEEKTADSTADRGKATRAGGGEAGVGGDEDAIEAR